jgi:hypothetical protein
MTFHLLAHSAAEITAVRLFLEPADGDPFEWEAVVFEPGAEIAATATLDLALFPLPPFAAIAFWWTLTDSGGLTLSTEPQSFQYEDNRFTWERFTDGAITVHWYAGTSAFGQSAHQVATNALPRINRDLRAPLPPHTDLYIYATAADIQAALLRLGRTWADGHADPTLGVVLVVAADDLRADFALQREIPHELTHVLLYHAAGDNLRRVPQWLNEGLAGINQGQPESDFPALLEAARASNSFHNLAALCAAFPAETAQARLAYAQSESLVRYLRDRFGSEATYALVQAYGSGAACNAGVETTLGLSLEELSAAWLRDVIYADQAPGGWAGAAPWLLLAALVVVAPLGFLLFARRRMV